MDKRKHNRNVAMKAVLLKDKTIHVEEVPVPVPAEDEALLKVMKAGICNTDLELAREYMDFEGILGHEFVGRVVQCSEKKWEGERAVGEINIPCGCCITCKEVDPKHCPSRSILGIHRKDGAFAEYVTLPLDNLHVLPPTVSDIEAVFIEPLAAALAIFDQVRIEQDDDVLVLGDGKLGLLIAQVIQKRTEKIFCAGHHPRKLALLQKKGIHTSQDARNWDRKFDVVIEATGTSTGIEEALALVRAKGKIIAKSTFHSWGKLDYSALVVNEIQLIGSRCGSFRAALDFLSLERIDLEEMVDADFPLMEAKRAFKKAEEPGVMKVVLSPE
jgi:threonine dehydrogenase-like Zn-dependent dehydrogenase